MDSMFIYKKIENRLRSAHNIDPNDRDLVNLSKCRAIKLTHLYHLLSEHSANSFISASYRDSLSELVYAATEKGVTNPLSLSPALALHILEQDLVGIATELNDQFSEVEQRMREWFVGYCERRQESSSDYPGLPELQWSDLPNELFGLMLES